MSISMTIPEQRTRSSRAGFTLIELIIVIAILGILAVTIGPGLFRYISEAKFRKTETTVATLKTAIDSYYASVGKYPTTLTDLVRKPADVPARKWVDKYLELDTIPKDPWNEDYVYKVVPKGPHPYELYSYGPTGPGSAADEWISAWK